MGVVQNCSLQSNFQLFSSCLVHVRRRLFLLERLKRPSGVEFTIAAIDQWLTFTGGA